MAVDVHVLAAALAACLVVGCGGATLEIADEGTGVGRAQPEGAAPGGEGASFVLRINCGSAKAYTDPSGRTWQADQAFPGNAWGYEGGVSLERFGSMEIRNTDLDPVYRTERYSLNRYRVEVPNGRYSVSLHVAETYEDIRAIGERVYHVSVEDENVLTDFDPFKEAGGAAETAVVKAFDVEVADGELTIDFKEKVQNTMINGIEVVGR